ncbi:hypothetical protein FS827_27750 [Agrobacterium vitis]|uniref:hypothetical protein n=1 Tax=Allorhizobium ampelinum TaxID=3025782 RepID=UPI001F456922|nr:hypothetical protein [Allorhizobium ampelinum]MCF1465048.1 hypothetical protein [Allorhizobium ampelinum]
MYFPLGYSLVPLKVPEEVNKLLDELFSMGFSRSRVTRPLSFDQDVCPSSFDVFQPVLSKHIAVPENDDFYAVYKIWDNLFTMLAHAPYILDVSDILYFETLQANPRDDYIASLQGSGSPDPLPPSATVVREMFDIVDRSNRSFFFAMKTDIDMSRVHQNEFGLIDSEDDAHWLYKQVDHEKAHSEEIIRLIKISLIDKVPFQQEIGSIVEHLR